MLYTTEKRIEIYKQILTDFEVSSCMWSGICLAIMYYAKIAPETIPEEFTEFWQQRPHYCSSINNFWWPKYDKESRITALKAAIILAESTL